MMSLGKYSTKLYHRGRTDYSCCVSGVITLLLVLFSVLASVSILSTTFSKEVYTLTESSKLLSDTVYADMTFNELTESGIKMPVIETLNYTHKLLNIECKDILIYVNYVHSVHSMFKYDLIASVPMVELNLIG